MKVLMPALVALLLVAQPARGAISFTQIDDDVFMVTHRVKVIGSRGKASAMVYTKAASLCKAAGFSHLLVLGQESEAGQQYESANASLRVKFFFEDADERIDCSKKADAEYIAEARSKLQKKGYIPPSRPEPAVRQQEAGACAEAPSCSIEQIAAMARAGLSDEKIKAACS